MEKAWLDEAVVVAKKLWDAYLINPSEEGIDFVVSSLDQDNVSIIGTGVHEFYSTREVLLKDFMLNHADAGEVAFTVIDEYYEPHPIGSEACCVAGTIWVRERSDKPKQLLVEMDTRFSMIFHRVGERWLLSHLHHSVADAAQQRGEFYPKTMLDRANAALEYSKVLERRVDRDPMTDLLNHVAFETSVFETIEEEGAGGAFFMIDLDNFKLVNDTLGHPEGDKVIIEFAELLEEVFSDNCHVGRMGGDEFAAYLKHPEGAREIEEKARELVERWSARSKGREVVLGCSVGLARTEPNMTFDELYRNADVALYRSKRVGKGCFCW